MGQITRDWRQASLSAGDAALLAYAEKLTREPALARSADLDVLRAHGFDDVQIHDAVQVISYFNYINRIADGLGVDLEESMAPRSASLDAPQSNRAPPTGRQAKTSPGLPDRSR